MIFHYLTCSSNSNITFSLYWSLVFYLSKDGNIYSSSSYGPDIEGSCIQCITSDVSEDYHYLFLVFTSLSSVSNVNHSPARLANLITHYTTPLPPTSDYQRIPFWPPIVTLIQTKDTKSLSLVVQKNYPFLVFFFFYVLELNTSFQRTFSYPSFPPHSCPPS